MTRKRVTLAILAGALLALAVVSMRTLSAAGSFDSLTPRPLPAAELIDGLAGGSEDITFRPGWREAFITSSDFNDPDFSGRIYLFEAEGRTLRDVTPELDFPFQPHGLDVLSDGSERLFVVNHRADATGGLEHSVEIFDVAADGSLTLARSVLGEALVSPNDVAAIGAETFYVTNDHGFDGFMRMAEDYLRLPVGNVVFFDGSTFRVAYEGTRYANGIKASADGRSLFLTETTEPSVTWLDRDPTTGALTRVSALTDWVGPDNITFDPNGIMWLGAHPKLLRFVAHAKDHAQRSPSQILRVQPHRDQDWEVSVVYENDGNPLSGSSVAASNGELLIVGTVFEHALLVAPVQK